MAQRKDTRRPKGREEGDKPYEPTSKEKLALESYKARRESLGPKVRLKFSEKRGTVLMEIEHSDQKIAECLVHEAFGVSNQDALDGLIKQLINFATIGKSPNEADVNSAFAMVEGIQPRDNIEAMLALQMVAVHNATMTFARRLNHVDNIPQQDSAERAFNKLARTFASQVEALNRHRGKGQQKVTVEHVHVHEGGQAIVGNVSGGGGTQKREVQADAKQITHAPVAPLPSYDAEREIVPVAQGEKPKAVPYARRRKR